MLLDEDDDDDGEEEWWGENDELDRDETLLGESCDDVEEIDKGPAGESTLITGGDTHPELISWLDWACGTSSSSSESDSVRSITSIFCFLLGEAAADGGESGETSADIKELDNKINTIKQHNKQTVII